MTADQLTAMSSLVMAIATLLLVYIAHRALGQVNEARVSRHAVTATDFSRRWDDPDMIETRSLTERYNDPSIFKTEYFRLLEGDGQDRSNALKMQKEANYLEDLAILSSSEAIDKDFIVRSLGYIVVSRWDNRWKDVADEYRSRDGTDHYPAWRELACGIRNHPSLA